jgi:hypothetical protein
MQTVAAALLAALLALYPGPRSRDIELRLDRLSETARLAADAYGVPYAVLISVAFRESHLGLDRASGGCWGAPKDRRHRNVAGTAGDAARALRRSYEVCGTWRGAISRFRIGLCRPTRATAQYNSEVVAMIQRVSTRAGVEMPANF